MELFISYEQQTQTLEISAVAKKLVWQ